MLVHIGEHLVGGWEDHISNKLEEGRPVQGRDLMPVVFLVIARSSGVGRSTSRCQIQGKELEDGVYAQKPAQEEIGLGQELK